MKKPIEDWGSMMNKGRLKFKNNKELKEYYEEKWKKEGYTKGYIYRGIKVSEFYKRERDKAALRFLDPKKDEIILDAGCGDGKFLIKISKKARKVYGVDITKESFKKVKQKSPKNLIFKEMSIENLKFKDRYFDKVVCVETLEHLLNPRKAIKEFNRILKTNGQLILTYPTMNTSKLAKLEMKIKIRKPFKISEHLTEWDYKTLVKEVERKSFKLVKSEGILFDSGYLSGLVNFSRKLIMKKLEIRARIKGFPGNSFWIIALFRKV